MFWYNHSLYILCGPKYSLQATNYTQHMLISWHSQERDGIKGWHILLHILILCQNSLAKPHWKFDSEPQKKLYGNHSQFAFYPNCHPHPISSSLDFIVPQHKPCCSCLNLKSYNVLLSYKVLADLASKMIVVVVARKA